MLKDLLAFLKDKGIEVPEGATTDQVLALLKTLLEADGGETETPETPETPEDPDKTPAKTPQGVA